MTLPGAASVFSRPFQPTGPCACLTCGARLRAPCPSHMLVSCMQRLAGRKQHNLPLHFGNPALPHQDEKCLGFHFAMLVVAKPPRRSHWRGSAEALTQCMLVRLNTK